jgi:hypothetical protein
VTLALATSEIFTFQVLARFFTFSLETLSMQTVSEEAAVIDIPQNGFNSTFSGKSNHTIRTKRLKISEFKSWAVSFGVISALTGLLMYLKVGVTMETITTSLFFLSLAGMIYSVYQIILLIRQPSKFDGNPTHGLN